MQCGSNNTSGRKMELTGEQIIPQTQAIVWDGLNDPEVLKDCITGCETIEKISDTEFNVTILAAVGPVKGIQLPNLISLSVTPGPCWASASPIPRARRPLPATPPLIMARLVF